MLRLQAIGKALTQFCNGVFVVISLNVIFLYVKVMDLALEAYANSSDSSDDDETDEGDTEEQGKRRQCPSISYDTSLPVQHTYLGSNLEELSGRTVLDDNSCQTIPLLTLPGVVLVPGQTLPLQLFHPATVSMMMHIIQSDRTFGLINSRYSGRTFGDFIDALGTTAEIRSYHEEGNDSLGLSTLRIKAEGRQRFLVLETRQQPDGMVLGKVRIMPESVLGDPGEGARLESLNRFRHLPPQPHQHDPEEVSVRPQFDPYSFAHLAHWPAFVYKLYDPTILMRNIKSQLHGWNDSLKTDYMPSDAREFSYWVAANLPLNDKQRLSLLSENNYIQRLRKVMDILESVSVLRCRDCHAVVADRKDIFSMSLQGPQGTYVNANGYVHEAITLYHVEGIYLVGRPSTVQSWFPGYAWRIGECENCRSHMGWKFNAVDKKLQPNKFWALCRSSITGAINVPFT